MPNRHVAVPLSQLVAMDADEFTLEAITDWYYWLAQRYCLCYARLHGRTSGVQRACADHQLPESDVVTM